MTSDVSEIVDKIPLCHDPYYHKLATAYFSGVVSDKVPLDDGMTSVLKGFFKLGPAQAGEVIGILRRAQDGEQ